MIDEVRALVRRKNLAGAAADTTVFAHAVLPFWEGKAAGEPRLEHVDPTLVIGAPFQGHQLPTDPQAKMSCLNSLAERWVPGEPRDADLAQYQRVGSLPLYVAIEGKNRVSLFAAYGRPIAAVVTPTAYSAAEIALHRLRPWLLEWGVTHCDDPNALRVLPFPHETHALLRAYGVREGAARLQLLAPLRRTTAESDAVARDHSH